MSNTILIKRSGSAAAVPAAGNLSLGELAINYADGNLFYKDSTNAVKVIASNQFLSVVGNVTANNGMFTNIVNVASHTGTVVSVTGNITGGNLNAAGLSLSGNVVSAINSTSNITTTGNITANYFLGNVACASGISTTKIFNGTSEANIGTSGGNANVTIGGTSNVAVFASTGVYVTGVTSVSGNITGGNLNAAGLSLSGNVVSGLSTTQTITATTLSATGNVVANNVVATTIVSAASHTGTIVSVTGNITGGNVAATSITGSVVSVTGAISGASVSVSGNVTGANVTTSRLVGTDVVISSTGNITLTPTSNVILGSAGNIYINNVASPVQDADAANKGYVDSVAQGLDVKTSVTLASAANLSPYTYSPGSSGVGATLTAIANGALSLDSTSTTANARVLIKNEAGAFVNNNTQSAAFNGIYVVTQTGNATAPYILTRSTDFDVSTELPGAFTFVEYGSTLADTGWVCTNEPPITIGSTSITFVQFSGAGSYTAGAALSLTGTQFNVITDSNANPTISVNGSNRLVVPAGAAFTTPNIGAATGTSVSVTGNITGGNVNTTLVSATGNVVANNVVATTIVSATSHTGTIVSVTGNITGGNLTTAGLGSITTLTMTSGNVTGTTASTGTTTGAFVIAGGLGVAGNVYGGALYDNGTAVLTVNSTVDGGTY